MSLPPLHSSSPSKGSVSHHSSIEPRGVPHFDREYAKQLSLARRGRSASQHSSSSTRHSLSPAEQLRVMEHDIDAPHYAQNRNFLMEELPLHKLSESIRANVPKLKEFVTSHVALHRKTSPPPNSAAEAITTTSTTSISSSPYKEQGHQEKGNASSAIKQEYEEQHHIFDHSPEQRRKTHTSTLVSVDDAPNLTLRRPEHATDHISNTDIDQGSFVDSIKATLTPEFMLAPLRAAAGANNSMSMRSNKIKKPKTNNKVTSDENNVTHFPASSQAVTPSLRANVNTNVDDDDNDYSHNNHNHNTFDPTLLQNSIIEQTTNATFEPAMSTLGLTLATLPKSAVNKLIHSNNIHQWVTK